MLSVLDRQRSAVVSLLRIYFLMSLGLPFISWAKDHEEQKRGTLELSRPPMGIL